MVFLPSLKLDTGELGHVFFRASHLQPILLQARFAALDGVLLGIARASQRPPESLIQSLLLLACRLGVGLLAGQHLALRSGGIPALKRMLAGTGVMSAACRVW